MSDSKIQVKVGIVEFSGEGNQDWLAKQLDKILDKVPELLKIEVGDSANQTNQNNNNSGSNSGGGHSISGLSVLNIAGKLENKSGSDLVIIAAAFLHFIENKPTFTRDDISSAMKKATGVYKESYMGNLTKYLTALEKSSTLLKNGTTYSLSANKVNELNAILSK
ncbi:MAG: hypothetical protein U0V75_06815 [Ferruginibacter sp.]